MTAATTRCWNSMRPCLLRAASACHTFPALKLRISVPKPRPLSTGVLGVPISGSWCVPRERGVVIGASGLEAEREHWSRFASTRSGRGDVDEAEQREHCGGGWSTLDSVGCGSRWRPSWVAVGWRASNRFPLYVPIQQARGEAGGGRWTNEGTSRPRGVVQHGTVSRAL
jgi:hypothetical protein